MSAGANPTIALCSHSRCLVLKSHSPQLSRAIVRGRPADPFLERAREDKRILVADRRGHDFDLIAGRGQQFRGAFHAEVGDLVHGAAAEFLVAEPAQMFRAEVTMAREFIQVPFFVEAGRNVLPQMPQPIIDVPRLGETQDVSVNEVQPTERPSQARPAS